MIGLFEHALVSFIVHAAIGVTSKTFAIMVEACALANATAVKSVPNGSNVT